MSMFADLHLHTTASDGQLTIDSLPTAAKRAGVSAVAVTDHDAIHPDLDAPITIHDGIEVIRGIELRVEPSHLDERVDLLGYGVTESEPLAAELHRLQEDRKERAAGMVSRIEDQFEVDLGMTPDGSTGRPHLARAIDEHDDIPHDYESAFDNVIHEGGDIYRPRHVTPFVTGLELLRNTCGVVGLAHPYRYDDPLGALSLTKHLDAVEVHYPYSHRPATSTALNAAQEHYDLLDTGGSDAHDETLGRAGLIEAHYEEIRNAITD